MVSQGDNKVLSTLLGSCVAACLYDPVKRIFGMNHFLLASRRSQYGSVLLESEAGRYGIHAMELLINQMLRRGAQRNHLVAKVFGGANVLQQTNLPESFAIGELNQRFILMYLEQEGIPLLASDLGGDQGRQIHFVGSDFSVYVKLLGQQRVKEVEQIEYRYLNRSLLEQQKKRRESRVTFL